MAIKINGSTVIDDSQNGTLTGSQSVTGNITGGNLLTGGTVSATGNITGGNVAGTNITGTLSTAAQPNVTSVGTLSSLSVSGNVQAGNLRTAGLISSSGTITGTTLTGTALSGTLSTAAQPNVTSVGTLTSLNSGAISSSGNVTGANLLTGGLISATGTVTGSQFNGSGAGLTSIPGGNVTGTVANATYATSAGSATSATSATTAGTVTTAAQGNITSVGTLTSLTVSGAITVNSGGAATAIVNGSTDGIGNIGASGDGFNTVFAKATSAQYADVAEKYTADAEYAPGTVVSFGGSAEVTISSTDADRRVAGVVSTNPAYLMNDRCPGTSVAVALTGRVPVSVVGSVTKGDMMVSAGNGQARAEANPVLGTVIGKALEDFTGESGIIEVVVGRL